MNDIDASQTPQFNDGRGFDPVGSFSESPAQPFRGSLDGNNNTVTGLTITRPSDSGIGLFGFTGSEATLTNITLTGVNTTGDTAVGGLVGSNSGTVADARASGDVTGEVIVGGLVGFNNGTTANGIIRTARASVSVIGGEDDVGGLVGSNNATVEQSYFDIQATGQTTSAGGIGLTTTEMQGTGAAQNLALGFGETWQTVSGDYPELIALADSNSETDTDLVAEYAGEDDTVGPFDVITAIDDFRQQQLGPFEVLAIIQAFRD